MIGSIRCLICGESCGRIGALGYRHTYGPTASHDAIPVRAGGNGITYYEGNYTREDRPLPLHTAGLQQTASGYGAKLVSPSMARFPGGIVRRIYVTQYSNVGSAWVTIKGTRIYIGEPSNGS